MTTIGHIFARLVVHLSAAFAPASQRGRWREEWLAEIDAASQSHSSARRSVVRRALGAPLDALLSRRAEHTERERSWSLASFLPGRTDWLLAWRQMRRTPVVNVAAVLALAVGIGLTLVAWTVVRGVFYLPLPGPDGHAIYRISDYNRDGSFGMDVDLDEFNRRKRVVKAVAALGAFNERPVTIGPLERSRVITGAYVTTNTFEILGVSPSRGRGFREDDSMAGGADVILIREPLAIREFGSAAAALGADLHVDGRSRRIVGIVPANCRFPFISDLWIPFASTTPAGASAERSLRMFGRLATGASPAAASEEMRALLLNGPPQPNPEHLTVIVSPFGRPPGPPEQQFIAWIVIAVFVLLLAVAAATVAHLMLARAMARRQELAVCLALGATRRRLAVQLFTEALALGLLAAGLGIAGATTSLRWLVRTVPDLPYWVTFGVSRESLLVLGGLTALATAIAGVGPALRATGRRAALTTTTRTSTVRFGWIGSALIAVELAVAVGFLSAAASLGRGLLEIGSHSYALPMNEVAVSQLYYGAPPESQQPGYAALPREERQAIGRAHDSRAALTQRDLVTVLRQLPAVRAVAIGSHFPGNEPPLRPVETDRPTDQLRNSRIVEIGEGYFSLLDARLLAGRDFTASELQTLAPVAIVNDLFARRYFGTTNVAGRQIRITEDGQPGVWREIVGVVPDLGLSPAAPSRSDGVYIPMAPTAVIRIAVRRPPDPRVVTPAVHEAVRGQTPQAAVQWTQTLTDQLAEPVLVFRSLGGAVLAMGAVALLLACTGIHALVAFAVAQRRREIAVRVALGANRSQITRTVLSRPLWQLMVGALLGGAIALFLDANVQQPFDLERTGPLVLGGVLAMLVLASLAACATPLRRALSYGPAESLRDS